MLFPKLTASIRRLFFHVVHEPRLRGPLLLMFLTLVIICFRATKLERPPSPVPSIARSIPFNPEQAQSAEEEREKLFHPFPFPDALQTQVAFWKKVFTEYTTKQAIIHDDRYMNVVYEVISIDFQEKKAQKEAIRTAVEKYETLLGSLAEHWDTPSKMTATEQQIRDLFRDIPESVHHKHKDAKGRIHVQIGQADRFQEGIIRSGQYMPAMKQIFAERGLPDKLAYLPLIESAFNPAAKSPVGAAGMWQFMKGTGKQYGLKINSMVDERKDPLLAARAAAELLGHNYESTESWPLAVTAYNFGLQGIRNAAKDLNTEDIATLIERYTGKRFGYASRNFYVEFLTAVDVCMRYTEYFGEIELKPPLELAQVRLPHYISPKTLEKHTSLSVKEIKALNPALASAVFRKNGMIPRHYQLNIPKDSQKVFEAQYAAIPEDSKYAYIPVKVRHKVRKGEALSQIAQRYDVRMKDIMRVNRIKNAGKIRIGQVLKIPGGYVAVADNPKAPSASSTESKAPPSPEGCTTYRVRKGETLIAIAQKHQTSVATISKLNDISDPGKVRAGQRLLVPSTTIKHKVKKGQTLITIAKLHNISVRALTKANQIRNPRRIKAGQVLIIPKG
ncbi:hypothetical protein CSB45_06120 [candidate division KSB3 bacterium]|uniref:LysM domain-containing protein n=1 Tax=candidate division KSB3 bacterium TaxID=2044937 RepID=A0A2G6E6T2_9BACT|nr:MAG: hypothetical protein CSB45_06120 [candidate division KSB3 bacterium]PIE30221.1 MAG: hypothetical protein CSA57_04835 [candidate division KSB3 bacterium]